MNIYGVRSYEVPSSESTYLGWSNAAADWACGPVRKKKGELIRLDANELVVPYPSTVVSKFVDALPPLPLYYLSTEARMRGEALEPTTKLWLERWRCSEEDGKCERS